MTEYITVKLTRDQARYILDNLPKFWDINDEIQTAFNTRIRVKLHKLLAQAKS